MSGAKGPLGSLQDEILFSTTPSFGTESLGKPRPGKNAAAKPRGTTGSMGPVILPRLPAAVKKPVVIEPIMSASHSPVRPKSQPSVQVPESRRPAQAIQPAATKPAQSAAAVPTSAPTPSRQEIVQQSRSQVREPVPAANRVDSKPAAKPSAASDAPPVRPPPSLSAAPAPAPASQPTISPVARPTSGARRAGRTLPSTEPAPAPVSRPSSAGLPKRRAGSAGPRRGNVIPGAPQPPRIESLEDIEDLRRRQNEQLLWVIEAEQGKEIARATVLATERKARRRKMLEDTFDMERRAAQEKIEAMKRDNELVLVAYMTQLGFTR